MVSQKDNFLKYLYVYLFAKGFFNKVSSDELKKVLNLKDKYANKSSGELLEMVQSSDSNADMDEVRESVLESISSSKSGFTAGIYSSIHRSFTSINRSLSAIAGFFC